MLDRDPGDAERFERFSDGAADASESAEHDVVRELRRELHGRLAAPALSQEAKRPDPRRRVADERRVDQDAEQ